MTLPVMMKCGCASFIQHMAAHDDLPPNHPSCGTHSCCEVDPVPADMTTRRARCSYFGKSTSRRNNECNFGERNSAICHCEQPSSTSLPFFKYLGATSQDAQIRCVCGFYFVAHLPAWRGDITVSRRWYKTENSVSTNTHDVRAATEFDAMVKINERADFFRRMSDPEKHPDTFVRDVVVSNVRRVIEPMYKNRRTSGACSNFRPKGASEFDEFYCGCHSWD